MRKSFGLELDTQIGLQKLYESHNCKDICRKFNINEQLLYRRLKRFKIPIKPKDEPKPKPEIITEEVDDEKFDPLIENAFKLFK